MAILDHLEVQVVVDGAAVNEYEYDDDDDDQETDPTPHPNTVTKYAEVVSGSRFEIHVVVSDDYKFTDEDALNVSVYLDGGPRVRRANIWKTIVTTLRQRGLERPYRRVVDGKYWREATGWKKYRFYFADLETREKEPGDDPALFRAMYGDLGTLRVEIFRNRLLYETDEQSDSRAYNGKMLEAVPEKALKGRPLDVATRLEPIDIPKQHGWINHTTEELDASPLATFIFKYRTQRALQALLVIPRSPSPTPLEERPIDELSREEMAELLQRYKERSTVKQEGSASKRGRDGASGFGQMRRPLKTSRGANGQTIYHLDSDDDGD